METDLIWQIFASNHRSIRKKLLLLTPEIYASPLFIRWKFATIVNELGFEYVIAILSDEELVSQLRRRFKSKWVYPIFKHGRNAIFYKLLPGYDRKNKPRILTKVFINCAARGNLELLKFTYLENKGNLRSRNLKRKAFNYAAQGGYLFVLKWIAKRFKFKYKDAVSWGHYPFRNAAKCGHLYVLKWLTRRFGLTKADATFCSDNAFQKAASKGHLHILKWMVRRFNLSEENIMPDRGYPFEVSAWRGNLSIIKWLTRILGLSKNYDKYNYDYYFTCAAQYGHLHILKWMTKHFEFDKSDIIYGSFDGVQKTIDNGYLDQLKWLVKRFELTKEDILCGNGIYYAAKNGHSQLLQWLTKKFQLCENDLIVCTKILSNPNKKRKWLTEQFEANWENF